MMKYIAYSTVDAVTEPLGYSPQNLTQYTMFNYVYRTSTSSSVSLLHCLHPRPCPKREDSSREATARRQGVQTHFQSQGSASSQTQAADSLRWLQQRHRMHLTEWEEGCQS